MLSTQSERMLLRDEKVLRLDSPKTTVILHYDQVVVSQYMYVLYGSTLSSLVLIYPPH